MAAPKYHLITEIRLSATQDQVWDALTRSESWPSWWRWLRKVDVLYEGDPDGLGRHVRNMVATPLGYRLTYEGKVVHVVEPVLAEFEATGDLMGRGRFRLRSIDTVGTELTFTWLVETPMRWMNLVAPVARPLLVWNHGRIMTDFAKGLATATDSELIAVSNRSLVPGAEDFYRLPDLEG